MTSSLQGTVAAVVGASSGIGAAVATALAERGATVALVARRHDRLDDLVAAIERAGGSASAHPADVTDAGAARDVVEAIVADHGRLDVLVNSAGWLGNNPALEADLADWQRMIDVNVTGVLNVTHAALPQVVTAAQGARGVADVVLVSSIAGRRVPQPESNVYAASKHAVSAFGEALRQELAPRQVRVGVIEPGVVRTEMTTSGREHSPDATTGAPLLPEDVADAVVFMVTRPAHAAVNEILLRPTEQVR